MLVGLLTIGKGTNYFVTPTTRIPPAMRPNSGTPNLVRGLNPIQSFMHLFLVVITGDCFCVSVLFPTGGHPLWLFVAGQLVWRRHCELPPPSHHVLRATCMRILPLVEMYCKWELEEDCTNLRSLMHRFDYETVLESHELGRYLLNMLVDDDIGFPTLSSQLPLVARPNPFEAVRERLAVAASAIRELHAEVHKEPPINHLYGLYTIISKKFNIAFGF